MKYLIAIILIISLNACISYQKCKDRFGTTVADTVKVINSVTVSIPRDSVITSFRNDTITFVREIVHGRTKVIVEKTPTITYIKAECDSATKTVTKIIEVQKEATNFGVNPLWQKAVYALLILLFIVLMSYFMKK